MNLKKIMASILVGDVKGFSLLAEHQLANFASTVLSPMSETLETYHPEFINTWGDGIIVIFSDPVTSARAALDLRDLFTNTNWEEHSLPHQLNIRLALHAGVVLLGDDPVTDRTSAVGSSVNLTARLESITTPGEVWASSQFVSLLRECQDETIGLDDLGQTTIKGQLDSQRVYRLRRASEPPFHSGSGTKKIALNQGNAVLGASLVSEGKKSSNFKEWLDGRGNNVYLAIVFTDIVGSTTLNMELGDAQFGTIRKAHFDRIRYLLDEYGGLLIKTIGDASLSTFRTATEAFAFARALHEDAGNKLLKIRAGIHTGRVQVVDNDAFGSTINFAARVASAAKGDGVWMSERAKTDIEDEGGFPNKAVLKRRRGTPLKGFADSHTLWSI